MVTNLTKIMHVHVQKTDEEKQAGFYKTEQCVLSNMYIYFETSSSFIMNIHCSDVINNPSYIVLYARYKNYSIDMQRMVQIHWIVH